MAFYNGDINQSEWEDHFRLAGRARFIGGQDALVGDGQCCDTRLGRVIIGDSIEDIARIVSDKIDKTSTSRGRVPAEHEVMATTDLMTGAYLALRVAVNRTMSIGGMTAKKAMSRCNFSAMAAEIGRDIHFEEQARFLEDKDEGLYQHCIREYRSRMNKRAVIGAGNKGWEKWGLVIRARIGAVYLMAMIESGVVTSTTVRFGKSKTFSVIRISEKLEEWFTAGTERLGEFVSCAMPMIEEPHQIGAKNKAGFHTKEMKELCGFSPKRDVSICDGSKDTIEAINQLQSTRFTVNDRVLGVFSDLLRRGIAPSVGVRPVKPKFPFNEDEYDKVKLSKEDLEVLKQFNIDMIIHYKAVDVYNSGLLKASRTLKVASELKNVFDGKKVSAWFSWFIDFRGRFYPKSEGLSPIGGDLQRGLLELHDQLPLGDSGLFWLKVHGFNCYCGEKVSFAERVEWVDVNLTAITEVAKNPTGSGSLEFWSNSKEPYQFLAFCFEYERMLREGAGFKTGLLVSVDGSCNAYQHIAAIIRSSDIGRMVNLVYSEVPQDIYRVIATLAVSEISSNCDIDDDTRIKILEMGIDRSMAKKAVIGVVFSVTRYSVSRSVESFIRK